MLLRPSGCDAAPPPAQARCRPFLWFKKAGPRPEPEVGRVSEYAGGFFSTTQTGPFPERARDQYGPSSRERRRIPSLHLGNGLPFTL